MRHCLFCGQPANSREDAWPRWIVDRFYAEEPVAVSAERRGEVLSPWRVRKPELKVRHVCRDCNNGWMSKLEETVKPILDPLLAGHRRGFDEGAQMTLAVWAVKTAMVLEALDSPELFAYTQAEREELRKWSTIPTRSSIWLAASTDPSLFASTKTRHFGASTPHILEGAATTIALSRVVVQVFTMRLPQQVGARTKVTVPVRKANWEESTVQILPASPSSVAIWPPKLGLDGETGIDFLSGRFAVAELPDQEVQLLAV